MSVNVQPGGVARTTGGFSPNPGPSSSSQSTRRLYEAKGANAGATGEHGHHGNNQRSPNGVKPKLLMPTQSSPAFARKVNVPPQRNGNNVSPGGVLAQAAENNSISEGSPPSADRERLRTALNNGGAAANEKDKNVSPRGVTMHAAASSTDLTPVPHPNTVPVNEG